MNKVRDILNSMDEVLRFNSEMIILSLKGEKPTETAIDKARKHCEILTEENVYSFDLKATNEELLMQIQKFASIINE